MVDANGREKEIRSPIIDSDEHMSDALGEKVGIEMVGGHAWERPRVG